MRRTLVIGLLTIAAVWALAVGASAQGRIAVPRGTRVVLAFDRPVDLSLVRTGDRLGLRVANNVIVNGRIIVRRGTPVTGVIERVGARPAIGRRGRIHLVLLPVRTVYGGRLALHPRGLQQRRAAGLPIQVRAGERLLAAVSHRAVVAGRYHAGRRYGYGYGYGRGRGYAYGRAAG